MEKNCLQCTKIFSKPYTRSRKDFIERAKFCSKQCHSASMVGSTQSLLVRIKKGGRIPWNKGVDKILVCRECEGHFIVPEWRAKQKPQFCSHACASQFKDFGKTTEDKRLRASEAYKAWRTLVFERDDYTCKECGIRGGKLHADHIRPFAFYPELRFEVSNGQTLCVPCHIKTPTYGGRCRGYVKKTLWAEAV